MRNQGQAMRGLAILVACLGATTAEYDRSDPSADHRARAVELDEAGDISGAIEAFKAATTHAPDSSESW
jgi:hypothetical protein